MIHISTQIQTPKDRKNTGTLHHLLLCSAMALTWPCPKVICLFHVRRIPDPWLHLAYLIVSWFSHALFGRKPVRSACPQLYKILRVTSTICSQARTTARWSSPLLSQTRLWMPVTHLHLPSQHPKLGVKTILLPPKAANVPPLCVHLLFSHGRKCHTAPPGPGPHWGDRRTLRGTQPVSTKVWRRQDRGNLCEGEKR